MLKKRLLKYGSICLVLFVVNYSLSIGIRQKIKTVQDLSVLSEYEYREDVRLNDSFEEISQNWMQVDGTREKFFIYSAYYERRSTPSIRIIAATVTRNVEKVWCRFWYKTKDSESELVLDPTTVVATVSTIRENWNLKYSAAYVMCPLPINQTNIPHFVSIVNIANTVNIWNKPLGQLVPKLVIQNREVDVDHIPFKIAICVKPMHYNFNDLFYVMEFIELYSIMGVSHFTFYNHTIGPEVECLLRDYMTTKSNITIEVLPWLLDIVSQKEIRTEGIFASLNDCLYRNMYKYSHVIPIDFDEFIIPHQHNNLPDLIKTLEGANPDAAAFSFQNAFFYKQHPNDRTAFDETKPISGHLLTLIKTRKKILLNRHRERSKYICKPEKTIELGNHFLWETYNHLKTVNVPHSVAFLHHYRVCEFGGDDCINLPWVIDRTTYRYKDDLIDRTTKKYKKIQNTCNLSEIKPLQ